MQIEFFDKEEYKDIPLYHMADNKHGGLPFFIKKYSQRDTAMRLHRHEYMQINYVYRGKGTHFVNNNEFNIVKGDIFVIPPYVPHKILRQPGEFIEIVEFEFVPEYINQNFDDLSNAVSFLDFAYIEPFLVSESKVKPRLNLEGNKQIEIEEILEEAIREYEEREEGFILIVKALLLKLLVIVGREFSRNLETSQFRPEFVKHKESIANAIEYLKNNYMKDLNADNVARKFLLSSSYFRYLFKSITSKTFTEYLNNIRIIKAMELLKTTDDRVLDISFDTGFNNVNHFNKVFKQNTGVSPLKYRKSFVRK